MIFIKSELFFTIALIIAGFFILFYLLNKRAEYMQVESDVSISGHIQKKKYTSLLFLLCIILILIGFQISAWITHTHGLNF
jgi:hypothetical protein